MPVPFGFGICDFVAIGQLAHRTYLSSKAAAEVFGPISRELESLFCVLEEAADTQLSHPLSPRRQARLKTILDGCTSTLADLQYIVQKYQSLGTGEKSTWSRLRLGVEDIAEIRSRLAFNIILLTAFRSTVIGTMSAETQTLPKQEYGSWQWVVELSGESGPEGVEPLKRSITTSSETDTKTLVDTQQEVLSLPQPIPKKTRLLSGFRLSSRKKRLISAIDNKKLNEALKTLNDGSATAFFDQISLDHALWSSARFPSMPLMEALLKRGANVDAIRDKRNVLWNAVSANNEDAVRFLLSKKVNLKIDHLSHNAIPLRAALRSDSMMSLLARNGAPLDAIYQISPTMRLNILQEAVSLGRESITKILLDNGAKVDACSSSHGTALMIALSTGRESIAKLLIQRGANVNVIRPASESCYYTNPVEAAILGRKASLLELLFRAGAVTDMSQALRFAQANSDYPLIPNAEDQYGRNYERVRHVYVIMSMLAQRDLRYVCFFRKDDRVEIKREGIRRMMIELYSDQQQGRHLVKPPGDYGGSPQESDQRRGSVKILVSPDDADVDIIFVHGIGPRDDDTQSHAKDTWTHENGTLWPQLLLPQLLPTARVLLFEYPLEIRSNWYTGAISGLRKSLLDETFKVRQKQEELHRPLVFIAHSLTGLSVKRALFDAGNESQFSCLSASTYGIICFATPREGWKTDVVNMALIISGVITGRRKDAVAEELNHWDKNLLLEEYSFGPFVLQHLIVAFYEQRKITYKSSGLDKSSIESMVYDFEATSASSEVAKEISVKLNRNHFDICKFSGVEDPEYQLVATHLEHVVTEARQHQVKCKKHPSTNKDVFSSAEINLTSSFSPRDHQDSENLNLIKSSEVSSLSGSSKRPSNYWSTKLASTLDTGNLPLARKLLHENFELVAGNNFAWLHELRDLGYSSDEMAEVLLNERNDSPWIYFKPRSQFPRSVVVDFHQPYCVHESVPSTQIAKASNDSELKSTKLVENRHSFASEDDTVYLMEELCGLAGISPSSRDPRKWNGQAIFDKDEDNMTVSIHFLSKDMVEPLKPKKDNVREADTPLALRSHSDSQQSGVVFDHAKQSLKKLWRYDDLARLSQNVLDAFQGFYSAVAEAQRRGICCNSFTILRNLDTSERAVELCRIEVQSVVSLFLTMKKATNMLQNTRSINLVAAQAEKLCQPFLGNKKIQAPPLVGDHNFDNIAAMLHYSSLAVQLLSLGFLSYIRAHVGAFHPFFLDTAIETVHLHGINDTGNSLPQISASLQRLTCLEDMIQKPVVVFGTFQSFERSVPERYDLLTTPEDFLDTWGPGQYVFANTSNASGALSAIMIGGGSVKPVAEDIRMLHWSKDLDPRHDFSITFNTNSKIRIGSGADQNLACTMNLSARLPVFRELLVNLGTNDDYWAFTELQVGLAITGQQFVGAQAQLNKTWTWHEGNTWKTRYFNNLSFEINYQELEKPWGLQVSFCTGVARRVPLRLLLADVMTTFANGLAIKSIWTDLEAKGIIAAFKGTHLQQWLNDLETHPQDLRITVNKLVRYILYKLRDTGIDRTRKFFVVASPEDDTPLSPISMCLKVPCEKTALWAKILEDSPNCATFACMTTSCLETAEHRCRAREPWDCPSLETAVCRHRNAKEPQMPQNSPWHLENQRAYWIGRPDAGLLARVGTVPGTYVPRLYISVSMMSNKVLARLGAMSHISENHKWGHIREKQVASWPAEDVIILSKASR